jgi:hypothetical protein
MPSDIALKDIKDESQVHTSTADDVEYVQKGHVAPKYMGTLADQRDMSALGREQVLRVGRISALSLTRVKPPLTIP